MSNVTTIKDLAKQMAKEQNRVRMFIARRTTKLMRDRLKEAYKECIRQFYEYETTSYIRYGQTTPGTKTGVNLYKGIDYADYENESFSKGVSFSDKDTITVGITVSSDNMIDHYKDTVDKVLNLIMNGVRFKTETADSVKLMQFTVKYDEFVGTPIEVLEQYKNKIADEIADQAVKDAIDELNGQLQYIRLS